MIKPNYRILFSRLERAYKWSIVSNLRPDIFTSSLSTVLHNTANDYVECKNCGVVSRMIRYKDLGKYYDDMQFLGFKDEWAVPPEDFLGKQ